MSSLSAPISFNWSIAGVLRGSYKQCEYGRTDHLFTVFSRLDCNLAPTKVQAKPMT